MDLEGKGSEGSAPRKRGKSGGTGQTPTADGARCSRATRRLAHEGGARLWCLGHGREGEK
jgi:hypothetical protein